MDTKKLLWAVFLAVIILSCDPQGTDENYLVNNKTSEDIKIILYEYNTNNSYDIFSNSEIIVKEVRGLGAGGFGDIGIFDSIKLINASNNKILKWKNPGGWGYIDTDNGVGTDRNIGKDFYNRKYWQFKTVGGDEEWTFTINEEDLNLFE